MGTFNAVPQSAVMRSNSWWRGVSSLRAGRRRFGGRSPRRRGRDSSVDAPGAPARRGVSAAFGMGGRGASTGALAASPGGRGAVSRQDAGFVQLQTSQRRHALVLVLREGPGHLFPASVPPQIYACLASLRGALSQLCRLAGLAGRDHWASRAVKSGAGRKRGTRDTQCDLRF